MSDDEKTKQFVVTLLKENAVVGVISGGLLREFEDVMSYIKPGARMLKARVPYASGRKDRLLAGKIMELLGMPIL